MAVTDPGLWIPAALSLHRPTLGIPTVPSDCPRIDPRLDWAGGVPHDSRRTQATLPPDAPCLGRVAQRRVGTHGGAKTGAGNRRHLRGRHASLESSEDCVHSRLSNPYFAGTWSRLD